MKTIYGFIQMILGACLGIYGVIKKDTDMIIIGCMLIICGKIDLNNSEK